MFGHKDPNSILSTHIKKLGVVDGCYHPGTERQRQEDPSLSQAGKLSLLVRFQTSEKLVSKTRWMAHL